MSAPFESEDPRDTAEQELGVPDPDELPYHDMLPADEIRDAESASPPPPRLCWRCGKSFSGALGACPYCRARSRESSEQPVPDVVDSGDIEPDAEHVAGRLLITFMVLMATSVIQGWVARSSGFDEEKDTLNLLLTTEVVDSLLILGALFWIPRRPRLPAPTSSVRRTAWLASWPLLGCVLMINVAYAAMLRSIVGVSEEDLQSLVGGEGPLWLIVLVICVQPAIFEELYFRHLLLDSLRRPVGVTTAVVVSSVMFGFAHLGQFLAIPVLIVVGLLLGYARVASGGLALPVLLHFVHNAVVLFLERTS